VADGWPAIMVGSLWRWFCSDVCGGLPLSWSVAPGRATETVAAMRPSATRHRDHDACLALDDLLSPRVPGIFAACGIGLAPLHRAGTCIRVLGLPRAPASLVPEAGAITCA